MKQPLSLEFGIRNSEFGFQIPLILLIIFGVATTLTAADAKPVDYAAQIKPILVKHCLRCHAAKKQESGLRLDRVAFALKGGDRGTAIVRGNSKQSVLYQAIAGSEDVEEMPPEGAKLSKQQIALIKRWIDEGANAPKAEFAAVESGKTDHWSFQPVKRHALPAVSNRDWVRNPIDAFVLARLDREGLKPSAEADRITLIRRLSLDLRGLPPSISEVKHFTHDERPGAYERLVDQMLASPRYGERWGRHWLDIARYADSNGFTIDGARSIWKYRDWVIDAWNRGLPFDQFTIEQLAGDMLPNATTDQIIATGFHRNTLINQEGGTDDEQFRVESIVDRVNTTGTVFLGLSVGCGQCHEHKFDPLSQREYYDLFAIFNNCDEPKIQVPSPKQSQQLKQLNAEIAKTEKPLIAHDAEFLKGLPQWEKQLSEMAQSAGTFTDLEPVKMTAAKGSVLATQPDKSVFVDFSIPPNDTFTLELESPLKSITAVRLEALTHPNLPKKGPGRADNGNFVLSEFELLAAPLGAADNVKPAAVRIAKAVADHAQEGYTAAHAIDGNQKTGWAINVKKGSLNVNREIIIFPAETISHAAGTRLIVKLHHNHSDKNYLLGLFRLSVSGAPAKLLETPASIRKILATPADKRTKPQQQQLANAYKRSDKQRAPLATKVANLKKDRDRLIKQIPTTMVTRERSKPRETHIMIRGDFLRKGARVTGGVPAALPPLPDTVKIPTRLDFARWLMDPANPLTARVTINRFWQRFFGLGFVATENDFGIQGTPPSHPKLLDWLASEFVRQQWRTKSIHRLIVTSATYRQSSHVSDELLQRDQGNRLLARQSRLRLEAETIRDVCLSASGLLSDKLGGPSVYPPQPKGIYVLTQVKKSWPENKGLDRYRRGMYTYFWRSSPYPFLPTFDAPAANTTCTRRPRSNTPLQALTLANDRAFVELAQGLAARILREAPQNDDGRIRFAFRVCVSRDPNPQEQTRLTKFLQQQRRHFETAPKQAQSLAPANRPTGVELADGAAWTAVARVLLNLDEFITRE